MTSGEDCGQGRPMKGARTRSLSVGCGVSALGHLCCVVVLASFSSRLLPPDMTRLDDDSSDLLTVDLASEIGPALPPVSAALMRRVPWASPTAAQPRQRRPSVAPVVKPLAQAVPDGALSGNTLVAGAAFEDAVDVLGASSTADVLDDLDDEAESVPAVVTVEPPPAASEGNPPGKIPHVSALVARALRVYDYFPNLPEPARLAGLAQTVQAEICVSGSGGVSEITMDHRAAASLEEALRSAIRTWRYRPLLVQGAATPFCHALEVRYLSN